MGLKLTKKHEYALSGLYYLAFVKPRQFVQVRTIAADVDVPKRFLEQIFLVLRERRILESKRGSQGGYKLAMAPEHIFLAPLFDFLEDREEVEPATISGTGADYFVWRTGQVLLEPLKRLSLADLLDDALKTHLRDGSRRSSMYYI